MCESAFVCAGEQNAAETYWQPGHIGKRLQKSVWVCHYTNTWPSTARKLVRKPCRVSERERDRERERVEEKRKEGERRESERE